MATFYTNDHEWIDFQGTVAYVGVCHFKLIGFKEIHSLNFNSTPGLMKKGDLIAIITYKDYGIDVHMPVDGKLVQVNEELSEGKMSTLLQSAESGAWLAKIIPAEPYERKGLLLPKQYQMNGKSKHAKQ